MLRNNCGETTPDCSGRWRRLAGEKRFSPLLRLGLTAFLSAVLALAALSTWQRMRTASEGQAGMPSSLPSALSTRLGVNVDLLQYDRVGLDRALDLVEDAGFGWVRQTFSWAEVEPQRGQFDWAPWDTVVGRVVERGLRLVAVLDLAPAWAQTDPASPHPAAPPQEVADFGRFASAFAHRYGEAIGYYQIWDEPNLSGRWGGAYADPTAYVRLLCEGYIQIKEADPSATVILAGLAPTVEDGPLNLNEVAFLQGIYAAGGAAFFDVAAAKPYGFWHRADDSQVDVSLLNFGRVQLLRQVMEARGDAEKPLWAAAFGWNALPDGWQGRPSVWGTDVETLQAADTVAAIERARRQWPWFGLMFLSHLQPDVAPDDPFVGFSLLDENGQPRPVYGAVRALASAPAVAWPGRYRPDHPSARYTGDWRVTAAGADVPAGADVDAGDARLTIPFHGTRLDLTVRRGEFWGVLYVTVDGQPADRLPRDSEGRAYLALYDPLHETQNVTLAAGLPDGLHEAVILPDGGWGQWAIAGWAVGSEPNLTPYRVILVLLAVATILCLSVTVRHLYLARGALAAVCDALTAAYRSRPESVQLALMILAAAAFFFAPGLALSLVALTVLTLLIFLRPDHGLALVAFNIPFFLRPKALAGRALSLVEIGTILGFGTWMVKVFLNSQFSIPDLRSAIRNLSAAICSLRAGDWAVASLVGLGGLSLVWAENFGVASYEFRVVILEAGLFYLLLRLEASRTGGRSYRLIADALVAGAVAASSMGLWQFFVSGDVITAEGVRRVRAVYGSPNNLALFLERVLPLLPAMALWGRSPWRRRLYALALLPLLMALFLTYSKGALFLGVPSALLFLGLMRGRRATLLALLALGVLAVALLPFVGTERFASTFDLAEGTAFFRVKLWRSALNVIVDHPLTGVGLDNFLYVYRTRYVLPEASDELNLSHPHNIVLDFWTRLGLGGVAVFLWLAVAFFHDGLRHYRRLPNGDDRVLVLGWLGGMVAALAHGAIDNAFFLVDLAFVFMLALAAVQLADTRVPEAPTFADDAEKVAYVSGMFARIAPWYDLMNRLMTGGCDQAWRRRVARLAALPPGGRVLDVATGTGEVALALARHYPDAQVIGADLCFGMMQTGRLKFAADSLGERISLATGDALRLPFPNDSFDTATTGFSLRNVTDVPRVLAEMYRVVKPGGRVVSLEISRPTLPLFRSLFGFYFYRVVPWVGGLISGQQDAYVFLPNSLTDFMTPEEVKAVLEEVGWRKVHYNRLMLGTVAVHVGVKFP